MFIEPILHPLKFHVRKHGTEPRPGMRAGLGVWAILAFCKNLILTKAKSSVYTCG